MLKPYTVMYNTEDGDFRVVCGPDFWTLARFAGKDDASRAAKLLNAFHEMSEAMIDMGYANYPLDDIDKFNAVVRELRGR